MPPSHTTQPGLIPRGINATISGAHIATTMLRRRLLIPGRPDRTVRQLTALARWGMTLAGGYSSATRRSPHAAAIIDDAGSLTYRELDDRTNRLARSLTGYPGTPRIGLLCRNHRGIIEVMIAAAKSGADVVLLNTGLSATQIGTAAAEHELSVLVTDTEFSVLLHDVPDTVPLVFHPSPQDDTPVDTTLEDLIAAGHPGEHQPPRNRGRTIVLTSGTTGQPKGARRPQPSLRSLTAILSRIPLKVHDRTAIAPPLFHTWGYGALQLSMAMRATVVTQPRFDPEGLLRLIARQRCRVLFAVPLMLQRILDLPQEVRARYDTSSLEVVALSGSALPGHLSERFMDAYGDILYNLYGSTEVSWISIATPRELRQAPGTAGRPPFGTKVVLRDDSGAAVETGQTGRIFAGNEMLYDGYTDGSRREATDGTMDSGDIGHRNEAGLLFVDGRADDMIVSGGENVFPREVEELLNAQPEVREAAVVGVDDAEFGQRLAAYLVLHDDQHWDDDTVKNLVRDRLARFSVPRDVHFIAELPRNATGKVVPSRLRP